VPEMHFRVEWPNGRVDRCYSPSYVVEEHLVVGETYGVADFVARARTALEIGSERVREKYGFACSSALDQLQAIEQTAAALEPAERDGQVRVLEFEKHAPRDAKKSG
jgi:uncharacterized repeat protein (TIGR04042 family)